MVARPRSERMVRSPCCEDRNLKKGPWTPEEDQKLVEYISKNGHGSWRALPKLAGLNRCGKSCRLRWTNYLRPDIKRGKFSDAEEEIIIKIHSVLGNKWSRIAAHLPGRTDNEIKNFWNTHVKKKFLKMGLDPNTHQPRTDFNSLLSLNNLTDILRSEAAAGGPTKVQLLHNILQMINAASVLSQNMKGTSLLGSYYNPTPMEGFVNSTMEYHHPNIQGPVGFPNSGVETPESNNGYQQDVSNSWAGIEGALGPEVLDFKNKYCSISASHDDVLPTEQKLPGLVSFSPESSINVVTPMEGKLMMNNPACASAVSSISDIFEAWGELIDDETGASYWKDLYP